MDSPPALLTQQSRNRYANDSENFGLPGGTWFALTSTLLAGTFGGCIAGAWFTRVAGEPPARANRVLTQATSNTASRVAIPIVEDLARRRTWRHGIGASRAWRRPRGAGDVILRLVQQIQHGRASARDCRRLRWTYFAFRILNVVVADIDVLNRRRLVLWRLSCTSFWK
jgi:hypothetical protein